MNSAEIKLNIFRLIDQIEDDAQLSKAYKKLLTFLRSEKESDGSIFTSPEDSIEISLKEISEGKTIPHDEVMAKYRAKYSSGK